jgi:histone H3/H4
LENVKMVTKTTLPFASVARIAKANGVERIGGDAIAVLVAEAEKFIAKASKDAASFANHAGRKTVKADDINLAISKE